MAHIIIDGYNLIRRSPTLSSVEAHNFQKGRAALIQKLARYREVKNHAITVVFDAALTDNPSIEENKISGIRVLYTEGGQTADAVLIDLAQQLGHQAIIVSSDKQILQAAKSSGCGILDSDDFEKKLNEASFYTNPLFKDEEETAKPIHKRWITKKRGTAKKLPKAKRKAMARLKGL